MADEEKNETTDETPVEETPAAEETPAVEETPEKSEGYSFLFCFKRQR
jgi:hypothetical protein